MTDRPRVRAAKRHVAKGDEHSRIADVDRQFETSDWDRLFDSLLPGPIYERALLGLAGHDVALSFLAGRLQAPAPKALIMSSLTDFAETTASADLAHPEAGAALRAKLGGLPIEALVALRTAAGKMASDPWKDASGFLDLADDVDWMVLAQAAREVVVHRKGGDYPDVTLHYAIVQLIAVYEFHTKQKPRMNSDRSKPSRLCSFVRTFFVIVDPELPEKTVDNALDQALRARRVNLSKSGSRPSQ